MAQFVNDTFTGEASGTLLSDHTSEGTTWTRHPSYSTSASKITSTGYVYRDTSASSVCVYYADGSPASADYSVTANIYVGARAGSAGPIARCNTSAATYYLCITTGTAWTLYRNSAGSLLQLGSAYSQTLTIGNTYSCKLECIGTAIKVYIDGTERISATNGDVTAAGKAAIWNNEASLYIDSVSADDVVAAAATSFPFHRAGRAFSSILTR